MYKKSDKVEIQVDGIAIFKGEIDSVKEGYVFVRQTNLDGSMPRIVEYKVDDPQLILISEEKPVEIPVEPITPDPVEPETPAAESNEAPAPAEQEAAAEVPIEEVKDETPAAESNEATA